MISGANRRHVKALGSIRDQTVRQEVAAALASVDHIGRTLPLAEVQAVIETLWLVYVAADRETGARFSEPAQRVLRSLAVDDLAMIGGRLDLYSLLDHDPMPPRHDADDAATPQDDDGPPAD